MKKIKDIYYYIQGWSRYHLYYNKYFDWLIPNYIHEQIDTRIDSMNRECFLTGSCIKCGCTTTALQMANKACDGECYPEMLNDIQWKWLKKGYTVQTDNEYWMIINGKFHKIKNML